MPTTLKNGMYVTPPKDGKFLTKDKKYRVNYVDLCLNDNLSFEIINDKGQVAFCLLNNCTHINNLNWKIVEL